MTNQITSIPTFFWPELSLLSGILLYHSKCVAENKNKMNPEVAQHALLGSRALAQRVEKAIQKVLVHFPNDDMQALDCLKNLDAARFILIENGLSFTDKPTACMLLQRCAFLLLTKNEDDAFKLLDAVPSTKADVFSAMANLLFQRPEEGEILGQDHFYMQGVNPALKAQALIDASKK